MGSKPNPGVQTPFPFSGCKVFSATVCVAHVTCGDFRGVWDHDSGCVVGGGVGGGVSCGVSGSVGGSVSIAGDGGGDAAALETARINLLV